MTLNATSAAGKIISFSGGTETILFPTDAAGAVNSTYVMTALNGVYNFFNRSGALLKSLSSNAFWCNGPQVVSGCPSTGLNPTSNPLLTFDPQVIYDAPHGRWITTAMGEIASITNSIMPVTYLGISQTSDPLGQWDLYYFYSCGNDQPGDQPKLGINNNESWLFVEHSLCTETPGVPLDNLHVFYQPSLYNGTPPNSTNHFLLSDPDDLDRPAVTYSPNPPLGWEFLASSATTSNSAILDLSYIVPNSSDVPVLESNYTAFVVPEAPGVTDSFIIPPSSTPTCNSCVGTNDDGRVRTAVVQNLSSGHPAVIVPLNFARALSTGNATALYEVALDISNPYSPVQMGGFASYTNPGGTIFYASGAAEGNGAVIAQWEFTSATSSGVYPSIYVASVDPANPFLIFKRGVAANLKSNRWGDYSVMAPDPVNANTTWSLGSFLNSNGDQNAWWTEAGE